MQDLTGIVVVSSLMLAAVLGFVAHRASVCTVKAVAEVVSTGQGYMFLSFLKTVLWVMAITIPFVWWLPEAHGGQRSWGIPAQNVRPRHAVILPNTRFQRNVAEQAVLSHIGAFRLSVSSLGPVSHDLNG